MKRSLSHFTSSLFVASLLALVTSGPARADLFEEVWKQGNAAYLAGDWKKAISAYDQLDRQGVVSADLYYNMGVAYFRTEDLGRAAWSFERAVNLEPKDDDAQFNLAQVRKVLARRTTDKIEGAERDALWIRVVSVVTPSAETWAFVVFYLLTFWFLFWRLRVPRDNRAPWSAAAALTAAGAVLTGLLLLGRVALDHIPFGIVLPDQVNVKEGADTNYRTNFQIHAGLRVRLLEQDDGWMRIRLANGLEGWVRSQDVGRL